MKLSDVPIKQTLLAVVFIGTSAVAAHLIVPREGEVYKSYRDGGGVWTICRGHTHGVKPDQVASDSQCNQWFVDDISDAERHYNSVVQKEYPIGVKAASVSLIFNAGAANFDRSTLRKKLNAGDRIGACNQFTRWVFIGPKDCRIKSNNCFGLVTRREQEKSLCLDNTDYSGYTATADGKFIGVKNGH